MKAYRGFESHPFRQSLPSQESPRLFGTPEKPSKRGLLRTKLLTAAGTRNAISVSLSPSVSKAPDFAILVRNFKRLILNGYSAQEIRTFRILLVARRVLRSKRSVEFAGGFRVYGTASLTRLPLWIGAPMHPSRCHQGTFQAEDCRDATPGAKVEKG